MGPVVTSGKSRLTWSEDGSTVTKTPLAGATVPWVPLLGTPRRAARNELRVNRLLATAAPPVRFPALVGSSRHGLSLTFEAVDGTALGPKFPRSLAAPDIDALIELAWSLDGYRPRRRWLRRFDLRHRLELHRHCGLLGDAGLSALMALAGRGATGWQFAHGDVTARNVLRDRDGSLWLIDWEWAGRYPPGYDAAFLWFSLIDVPGARAVVRASVPPHYEAGFVLSAAVIQLLHLQMWLGRPPPFIASHRLTLDELLEQAAALQWSSATARASIRGS